MSKQIMTKLETIMSKLEDIDKAVLNGKWLVADALHYNGLDSVRPMSESDAEDVSNYETWETYAKYIKRLKSSNSMWLQFKIASDTDTAYKRTVVLPLYFATNAAPSSLNDIAKEIIEADKTANASIVQDSVVSAEAVAHEAEMAEMQQYVRIDENGNEYVSGDYVPTMGEIESSDLTEAEQAELLEAMEELDIVPLADTAENAIYDYTVDWGDGTDECTFTDGGSYEDNKAAMWHTYSIAGTYDVVINGNFRYMRSTTASYDTPSYITDSSTSDGYYQDRDGSDVMTATNYSMENSLVAVVAWGNTQLSNMSYAFNRCSALASIPMYDSTNSFEDVTDFSYCFNRCTALTEIPYNSSTEKGLFSNCTSATTFQAAFRYCTALKGPIPPKFIDGCSSVTTVATIFGYCSSMGGDLPVGLFAGLTSLTTAQEAFASCGLSGSLSDDLFEDNPNLTSIYRTFYGCTALKGRITYGLMGKLTKLTDMRQAFYNCSSIEGIDADAFSGLTSNAINCRQAFYGCKGITSLPSGLLSSMTGTNLYLEKMFDNCTGLTSIAVEDLAGLKPANARGMFGGCTSLSVACDDDLHSDWTDYELIQKWYGVFANTKSSVNTSGTNLCLELNGLGTRRYSQGCVGQIVLADLTRVEPYDFVYSSSNKPVGVVYADVYLEPSNSTASLASGSGNRVLSTSASTTKVHKLFCTGLTDTTRQWTDSQAHAEDLSTITNTTNYNVAYNWYSYTSDGSGGYTQAWSSTPRYNGEAYTTAIGDFITSKGYDASSRYPAYSYAVNYSFGADVTPFLPDGADLWDQFTQREFFYTIFNTIISKSGAYTTSTMYPMRNGTYYWASAEYSSTYAWDCYTNGANVIGGNKWNSHYVRPSFALALAE